MTNGMHERSLLDLTSFIVDNRGRTCPVVEDGFPLIATNCISDESRRAAFTNVRHVDDETYTNWFRAHPQPNDVVFVCKGSPGRVALVQDPVPYCIAQDMVALRADVESADPVYLYYRLSAPDVRERIAGLHVGTLIPHFKKSDFDKLRFSVHSLPEQRRIASVLGALDDLIEIDRQLVSLLWAQAKASYDVRAVGATVTTLGRHLELRYGKALPARRRVPGPYPVVSSAGIVDSHAAKLVDGPGIVIGRKGTVGSVTWIFDDFFPIDTAFFVNTDLPMAWAYFALRDAGLEGMNTDSAVPGLNRENALSRPLPLPSETTLESFEREVTVYLNAIQELSAEIDEATRTRDELLPLLMSGKIRVSEDQAVG